MDEIRKLIDGLKILQNYVGKKDEPVDPHGGSIYIKVNKKPDVVDTHKLEKLGWYFDDTRNEWVW